MPSRRGYLRRCLPGFVVGLAGIAGCLDGRSGGTRTPTATDDDGTGTGTGNTGTRTSTSSSETDDGSGDDGTPTSPPAAGEVAWRRSLPGPVEHRPALAGDRLFAGSADGTVTALSVEDGRDLWRFGADAPIRGTTVVAGDSVAAGGLVVAVSGDMGDGDHYAAHGLDAGTGEERWAFAPEAWILTVLGVEDGAVFLATSDDHRQASGQTLYALSVADGSRRWAVEIGDNRGGMVTDGTVYVPAAGVVHAIGTDGTHRWSHETSDYRFRTLSVAGDTVAFVTAEDASRPTVHGLDAASGEERWTFAPEGWRAYTTRAVGDRLLVGGRKIARLDPATGEPRWVTDRRAALYEAPVVDGTLYASTRDATALSVEDGSVAWTADLDAHVALPAGVASGNLLLRGSANEDDPNRLVLALDTASGDRAWTFDADWELTRLAVGDGQAYAGAGRDLLALAV